MVTSAPLRILHLVLAYCLVSAPRAVCAQSSHATFSSGYPRVEYRNGTNTFKLFVALDRAGVAYFVAVPRVDQISNTTIPTTDEIFEVSADDSRKLAEALKKRLQREVHLSSTVDKSLLGGVIIRTEDTVIDNSVRGRLQKLARVLG